VKLSAPPAVIEPAAAALDTLRRALDRGCGLWYPTLGLGFAGGDVASAETLVAAASQARATLAALGGALVIHDAPADVRARLDVWGPPPASLELMRRLKAQLDPHGLLAPGRAFAVPEVNSGTAVAPRAPGPERHDW
jgi:glycolate oxidase FAD binding subunit